MDKKDDAPPYAERYKSLKVPFTTKAWVTGAGGNNHLWLSRAGRKGLRLSHHHHGSSLPFWKRRSCNRAIGLLFAIGALFFALASAMSFVHDAQRDLTWTTNVIYFIGSIPFTIAASLQHLQSANDLGPQDSAGAVKSRSFHLIGWAPYSAGWWSTFSQWLGTIAFNVSTFSAISPPEAATLDTFLVWEQNVEGSVFFLISGYLAFIEAGHRYFSWAPKDISWRLVFINLLGCIAFMIAALTPANLSGNGLLAYATYSGSYTFLGAVFFFWGALLSLAESDEAPV